MIRSYRVSSATILAALAACALVAAPSMAASGGKDNAGDNWAAMKTCATLEDAAARHVCTDAVLRSAGLLTPADPQAQPEVAQQPVEPAAPRPAQRLSPTEREAVYPNPREPKTQDAKKAEDIDRIEVTLAKSRRTGDGRLILTATDGVTWRQLYRKGAMPI